MVAWDGSIIAEFFLVVFPDEALPVARDFFRDDNAPDLTNQEAFIGTDRGSRGEINSRVVLS